MLHVVNEIACIAAIAVIAFKSLQRHNTLLCNQHHNLTPLVDEIRSKVGAIGNLSDSQRTEIDTTNNALVDSSKYAVAFSAVSGFTEDLGAFVKDFLTAMNGVNHERLLRLSASALVGLVDNMSEVVAVQTKDNQVYLNAALAVLSHQLVKVLPRDFFKILQCHQKRLEHTHCAVQTEALEREQKTLCDLYHSDPYVKGSIDSLKAATSLMLLELDFSVRTRSSRVSSGDWHLSFPVYLPLKGTSRLPT